jgi:hypothetical protein
LTCRCYQGYQAKTSRKPYDWSADVKKLTMPVMLIYGDSDMFRPEHEVKFYQLLGGGLKDAGWQREHMAENRLAILPDVTHYEMGVAPQMVDSALPFLNGQGRAKTWDEQVGPALAGKQSCTKNSGLAEVVSGECWSGTGTAVPLSEATE